MNRKYIIGWGCMSILLMCAAFDMVPLKPKKAEITPKIYQARTFNFIGAPFLSDAQKTQHYKLYEGYVKKLNEIRKKLVSTPGEPGITYSAYRALKIAETFALNGVLLHEYYFENIINGSKTTVGEKTLQLIEQSFQSFENFMEDLNNAAVCARGWVLTGYTFADGQVHNYVLDAHNETVPVGTVPLLIIDVYEHAYMIDFGINRASYLEKLMPFINWDVVESRTQHLV